MASKTHILNRLLPAPARNLLRHLALATIPSMRHLDMPKRLRNLQRLGFEPRVILDVGAARGEWAQLAFSIWPNARVFGFEPNAHNREHLERLKAAVAPRFDYLLGFLGPEERTVRYENRDTQTSLYDARGSVPGSAPGLAPGTSTSAEAPMFVLDKLIAAGRVPSPQFIKLDVQGFELEVLKGGEQALKGCEAALLEVSFYRPHAQVPTVDQVIDFLRARGFAWYDVAGIIRRPADDALWQMDLVFVKEDHALRQRQSFAG